MLSPRISNWWVMDSMKELAYSSHSSMYLWRGTEYLLIPYFLSTRTSTGVPFTSKHSGNITL